MDRITLCYFPFLERADMAFGSCSRGCVANAKFLAHSEAANIARRAVNRGSEKEQFGAPLFGGPYLQHNPYTFGLANPLGYTYATPYVTSNDGNITPANSLNNPFPAGLQLPAGSSAGLAAGLGGQAFAFFDGSARAARVHQYSVDLQRELPGSLVVAAGFTGSITHHLIQGTPDININQVPDSYLSMGSGLNTKVPNPFYGTSGVLNLAAATVAQAQLLTPYPQFGAVSMQNSDQNHAQYYAVYAKAQKRLGRAINVLTTLTWSRNMDQSNGGAGNTFSSQPTTAQDNYNLRPSGVFRPSTRRCGGPLRRTTSFRLEPDGDSWPGAGLPISR